MGLFFFFFFFFFFFWIIPTLGDSFMLFVLCGIPFHSGSDITTCENIMLNTQWKIDLINIR